MFDMDGLDYESIATELIGEPETHGEKNIRFECPYCHSYHKKFYLDTTRGIWNCYNCGEKGNIIKLIMNMLDCQYSNAIEYLKDWGAEYEDNQTIQNSIDENKSLYTSILQAKAKSIKNNNKLEPVPLPTNFKYLIDNFNNPESYPYLSYLKSRGVTLQQIIDYKIGYVVDGYTCKLTLKFDSRNQSYAGTYTYEGYDFVDVSDHTMFDTTQIIKKSGYIYDEGEVNGESKYGCSGLHIYAYIPSDKSYANVVLNTARFAKKFTT